MGLLLILFSPWIPRAYTGVTQDVREMASRLLIVTACAMPLMSFAHCSYFTLRSGGKTSGPPPRGPGFPHSTIRGTRFETLQTTS